MSNGCCGEPSSSSERQVWLLGDPGGVELRKPVVEHGMQTFALPSLRARALCEEKEEHSKISMASTWFRPVILRFHAGAGGVFGVRGLLEATLHEAHSGHAFLHAASPGATTHASRQPSESG